MPIVPDAADVPKSAPAAPNAFSSILEDLSATLDRAQNAENAFAGGHGQLLDAVYERARADVAMAVASAATGRVVQTVQSLLNMQV